MYVASTRAHQPHSTELQSCGEADPLDYAVTEYPKQKTVSCTELECRIAKPVPLEAEGACEHASVANVAIDSPLVPTAGVSLLRQAFNREMAAAADRRREEALASSAKLASEQELNDCQADEESSNRRIKPLSKPQREILRREFGLDPNWSKFKVQTLADTLGVSFMKVYKWNWHQRKRLTQRAGT